MEDEISYFDNLPKEFLEKCSKYICSFPECDECGMPEVVINEKYYDDSDYNSLCRVCANILFRSKNNIDDEEMRSILKNMKVLRPPINNKCKVGRCDKQTVFHCINCNESYCDEHKFNHVNYYDSCIIFEDDELWKQCFNWKLYCNKCDYEKHLWCEVCNCLVCHFHLEEYPNHEKDIELQEYDKYIDDLYEEAIDININYPILEMIGENIGIRPDYIINQLNLFIDN